MQTLVLYYSRTAAAARLAEAIARRTRGLAEPIRCRRYDGALGPLRAGLDSLTGRLPSIAFDTDLWTCGRLIVGGSLRAGAAGLPLRALFASIGGGPACAGVFLTTGGASGIADAHRHLDRIAPEVRARLVLPEPRVGTPGAEAEITRFLAAMGIDTGTARLRHIG